MNNITLQNYELSSFFDNVIGIIDETLVSKLSSIYSSKTQPKQSDPCTHKLTRLKVSPMVVTIKIHIKNL